MGRHPDLIMIGNSLFYEHKFCEYKYGELLPYKNYYDEDHYIPLFILGHTWNNRKHTRKTRKLLSKLKAGENSPTYVDGYCQERFHSKMRGLGFIPLNERTKIANEQHHIDKDQVVFITLFLHLRILFISC